MLLRRVARPLLASWFIYDGYDALRRPDAHVEAAREPIAKATTLVGAQPLSDKNIKRVVQAQGVATIVLGGALALSKSPRLAGVLLALSTAPHVCVRAPRSLSQLRDAEVVAPFVAKVGAVGAALLVAADTAGKPSMAWRVTKARADRQDAAAAKL